MIFGLFYESLRFHVKLEKFVAVDDLKSQH